MQPFRVKITPRWGSWEFTRVVMAATADVAVAMVKPLAKKAKKYSESTILEIMVNGKDY